MVDPTAPPIVPSDDAPSWFVGPTELAAVAADDALINRLAAGELPDPNDRLGQMLAAWLRAVGDGAGR